MGTSGNSGFSLFTLWICCKLCHNAAECSWAFRRNSATLAVNKISLEPEGFSVSVKVGVKLGVEVVRIEEIGVVGVAVEKIVSGRPILGGQHGQGKPGIPKI